MVEPSLMLMIRPRAHQRLQQRRPLALIADEVSYDSPSALARAFRRITGASPTEWQRAQA